MAPNPARGSRGPSKLNGPKGPSAAREVANAGSSPRFRRPVSEAPRFVWHLLRPGSAVRRGS
eukprot:12245434-Alexandrium_andersonii.AAC.1